MGNADLTERLRRLGLRRGAPPSQERRRRRTIEDLIPGEVLANREGACFLHTEVHSTTHSHGAHRLGDLLEHLPHGAARLARDERLAKVDPARIAFIDTETTGLAGGTGTYVFLVGVGAFEAGGFAIRQFFMRDFGEEPAQIQALDEALAGYEAVVSFNGKQFDMPLLETRFLMNRRPPRLYGAPHLDLLPPARAFWRHRLASCALSSLESEVLSVRREQEDVPGWLIPSLYAEYARTGDAREMPRIFYHNAQDILSMVSLAAHQCALLASSLPPRENVPGEDLYGLARILHDLGEEERAEAALALAAETSRLPGVQEAAMRDLAYLLKRQDRRVEALRWWRALAEGLRAVYACEELAKHYEWHDGDPARALAWTEHGLALAQAWVPGPARAEAVAGLEHRRERLRRKTEA
ncbi:MAG TPA: ribonuclease H-like domain-containing protein [Anaerolineae bacterium]|nr:ribonuclease H-like domain-containing protein [Anaerolineae bacterium]